MTLAVGTVLIVLFGADPVAVKERLTEQELHTVMNRWQSRITELPRQSVKFVYRVEQPEDGIIRECRGVYVVDSPERWALRIWETGDYPASAISPLNMRHSPQGLLSPRCLVCTETGLWLCLESNRLELRKHWNSPADAQSPINVPIDRAASFALMQSVERYGVWEMSRIMHVSALKMHTSTQSCKWAGFRLSNGVLAIKLQIPSKLPQYKFLRETMLTFEPNQTWPYYVATSFLSGKVEEQILFCDQQAGHSFEVDPRIFEADDYILDMPEHEIARLQGLTRTK